MIRRYFDDSARHLAAMRQALDGGEADQLRREAHSFKSSSAYLGAHSLVELCQKMEAAGRERQLQGAEELLARIGAEYAAACGALAATLEGMGDG